MTIATLALSAFAGPPRAEVLAGWEGTGTQGYGYVTVQPALLRSEAGSVLARATVSQLQLAWVEGAEVTRVASPGVSVGPAVVVTPGDFAFVLGAGVVARRPSTWVGDTLRDSRVTVDGVLTGDAFWRPGQRASIYTQASLGAAERSVWARAGATYPVTPREGVASLWLGLEATTSGPFPALSSQVGPVAEVPVRPLGGSLALRASTPVRDLADGTFALGHTNVGVAAYWAW